MDKTSGISKPDRLFLVVLVAGLAARLPVATRATIMAWVSGRSFRPWCGLTELLFTANFLLLGANHGSVGDRQFVR